MRDDIKNFARSDGTLDITLCRASQMVIDLGWVDFDLRVPPSGQAAQPHLPNSHQPGKGLEDGGILKIQSSQPRSTTNRDALYISRINIRTRELALHRRQSGGVLVVLCPLPRGPLDLGHGAVAVPALSPSLPAIYTRNGGY